MSGLGGVLLCRNECYPDAQEYIAEAREAGEQVDVTLWARRRYNRLHDNTRTERANRRNGQLNAKARVLGFDSASAMLTAWLRGEIEIPPNPNQ